MRSNLCKINFIMGRWLHYNIRKDKTYFMTMTVVDWTDLFTRVNQKQLIRNPVVDKIVYNEQDYFPDNSRDISARNYYGLPNVLEIDCLTAPVTTVSSRNFFNT